MKIILSLAFLTVLTASAAAQAVSPADPRTRPSGGAPVSGTTGYPIPGPFQALGNIIRNPTRPPPTPPTPVSGAPLPTAIPPNTVGLPSGG